MPHILYLHGMGVKPGGYKPSYLRGLGYELHNPDLNDDEFMDSVDRARADYEARRPGLIIGSSRGGAVALSLGPVDCPVVLIAPAWRGWCDAGVKAPPGTLILHSEQDAIIPFGDSVELAAHSGLPADAVWAVGHDHNMVDAAALEALREAVARAMGPP